LTVVLPRHISGSVCRTSIGFQPLCARTGWLNVASRFTPEGLVVILTAAGSGVGRQTAVLARHYYAAVSWGAFNALSRPPSAHLEKKI
jgi:hypothetical protein